MTEEYLIQCGYEKIEDNLLKKIDQATGMTVRLRFNQHSSDDENDKIENEIIKILARRDI